MRPEEHEEIYRTTLRFAQGIRYDFDQAEEQGVFPREVWSQCAEFGMLAFLMPAEVGGTAQSLGSAVAAFEAFGCGCPDNGLAFSLASQLFSAQVAIATQGTAAVKARYLPGLVSGKWIAAHGSSEADAGSDVSRIRTTAKRVPGGFSLSGSKSFSTLASLSDLAVVLARLEDGLSEFVVPRSAYRVSKPYEKIGLKTSPVAELHFEDAFVPEDHLLGHAGSGLLGFLSIMEWERLGIMASSVGAMERQLHQCVQYALSRKQFGVAIGAFQAVSHRLVEMRHRLETSRLLLYSAARKKDEAGRAPLEASLAKLHISESFHANALDAVRLFGAYGCMKEGGIERTLRDAVPSLIYSGTSDIQRNAIARLMGLPSPSKVSGGEL